MGASDEHILWDGESAWFVGNPLRDFVPVFLPIDRGFCRSDLRLWPAWDRYTALNRLRVVLLFPPYFALFTEGAAGLVVPPGH